jgi:hypothetical protein
MFQSMIESLARFVYNTSQTLERNGIEVKVNADTETQSNFHTSNSAVEIESLNWRGYSTTDYGFDGSPSIGFR